MFAKFINFQDKLNYAFQNPSFLKIQVLINKKNTFQNHCSISQELLNRFQISLMLKGCSLYN
jgi:hypothetical protein